MYVGGSPRCFWIDGLVCWCRAGVWGSSLGLGLCCAVLTNDHSPGGGLDRG